MFLCREINDVNCIFCNSKLKIKNRWFCCKKETGNIIANT